jgi:hypothetical protein
MSGSPADQTYLSGLFADAETISGYFGDPADWSRRWVVELLLDGYPVSAMHAALYDDRMPDHGQPSKDYGYAFDMRPFAAARASVLEVRLANSSVTIGTFDLAQAAIAREAASIGEVTWAGGLRLSGWLNRDPGRPHLVRGLIDDELLFECHTAGVRLVEDQGLRRPRPCFDVHLTPALADGRVHRIEVIDEDGRPLRGSPVGLFAFADGLAAVLESRQDAPGERIRGQAFDHMFPQSAPFSAFADWRRRYLPEPERDLDAPLCVILIGETGVEASLASLADLQDRAIVASLSRGADDGCFAPEDLVRFLEEETVAGTICVVALAGTLFTPGDLVRLVQPLIVADDTDIATCDVLIGGRPILFAAFDRERFLEQGHLAACFALRREAALRAARDERRVDSLPSLFLAAAPSDARSAREPHHVSGSFVELPDFDRRLFGDTLRQAVADDLRARGLRAEVQSGQGVCFPNLFVRRATSATAITVIIPVHRRLKRVQHCLEHLKGLHTRHKLDLILVDMAAGDPDLLRFLARPERHGARVVPIAGALNFARALNQGALLASAPLLLFLDPSVLLDNPDPLDELVGRCAEPSVAGVAPVLCWPQGLVQEAGLVVDYAVGATPVGRGLGDSDPGYGDLMRCAQERSALSAACLLIKAADFAEARGFDESFARFFYAVDFCLRRRQAGRRFLVSAHVHVTSEDDLHGSTHRLAGLARGRELESLRFRWGDALARDPLYSPLLALDGFLFSALAWPPRRPASETLTEQAQRPQTERTGAGQMRTDRGEDFA